MVMKITKINGKSVLSRVNPVVDKNSGSFNAKNRDELRSVLKAFRDKNSAMKQAIKKQGTEFKDKNAEVANAIYETVLKSGLARKCLKQFEHVKGTDLRVDVKYNNSWAVEATGPMTVDPVYLTDKRYYPTPVTISHNLMIDGTELEVSSGDILSEKREEGENAVRVKEDRLFKNAFNKLVALGGNSAVAVGSLTPNVLISIFNKIRGYNLQVGRIALASNVLDDLMGTAFQTWFSQYDRYKINATGTVGNILGVEVETDAYLDPVQHVLEAGEVLVMTNPENFGGICDLNGVTVKEVDGAVRGVNGQGYFISEIIGMLLTNYKGAAKVSVVR